MNVVHIITCLGDGGAEAVLYRLCTHDFVNRHLVVSLRGAGKYGPLLEQAGVRVYCLDMRQGRLSLRGLLRLWRLLRSRQPDVVQTWMYHADLVGGVIAKLAGIQKVFWGIRRTSLKQGRARRSTILVARLCAMLSHWVPLGIVCCAERALLEHRNFGYAGSKMRVVINGYDLQRFKPDNLAREQLRNSWQVDTAKPLLGMVGRYDPNKDHENLLKALSNLKRSGHDFQCVIVGSGIDSNNPQLVEWLNNYNLCQEVLMLGQRDDIPALMNALDINVLSSAAEAFPNVLAEAMACGTPCVTTDVGDAGVIVGDTGWVVPPEDSQALADALRCALQAREDDEAWRTRQTRARQRIENNFSLATMVAGYHDVWRTKTHARESKHNCGEKLS